MSLYDFLVPVVQAIGGQFKSLRPVTVTGPGDTTVYSPAGRILREADTSSSGAAVTNGTEWRRGLYKISDGVTAYNVLPYVGGTRRTVLGSASLPASTTVQLGNIQLLPGVKRVFIKWWSGGFGGGSGSVNTASTSSAVNSVCTPGAGGGGGSYGEGWLDVSSIPTTLILPYQLGRGLPGAVGRSAATAGSGSTSSTVGSVNTFVGTSQGQYGIGSTGGNGGGGGQNSATVASTGGPSSAIGYYGPGLAGAVGTTAGGSTNGSPLSQSRGGSGGGSGGGITISGGAQIGGQGGYPSAFNPNSNGAAVGGNNGGVAASYLYSDGTPITGGQGGGGGSSNVNANGSGGAGSRGAWPGGGGGGGGSCLQGTGTSGAGGDGANGAIEFIEHFLGLVN